LFEHELQADGHETHEEDSRKKVGLQFVHTDPEQLEQPDGQEVDEPRRLRNISHIY
jgi:hypothetical protein